MFPGVAIRTCQVQRFLWHILAIVLTLVPGNSVGEVHPGDSYFFNNAGNTTDSGTVNIKGYPHSAGHSSRNVSADTTAEKEKQADSNGGGIADRKNKITEIAKTSVTQVAADALQTLPQDQDQQFNGRQALHELERKLDYRMRVAATNFTNNTAQGFVQQSLPQILFGQHWLAEKFQYLSTLAWQTGDDEGGILGELDLVVPLYGARNASGVDQYGWFLQPGLVSWEADNGYRRLDVNVGLVYRQLVRERIAVGASVFYDHNIDTDLSRLGVGADWVSPYTYFSANYYQPLNGWRNGERLGYEERALRGFDVNVEQALWDSHWVLEASAGYWEGYDAEQRKADWEPSGGIGIRFYPWHHLSLYADYAYHHDHVDTDRFAVGIEFSYPGKNRGVSTNEIDLWRPVKREKRILYAEREIFPARIGVSSSSSTIDINFGEDPPFSPEQLRFTVTVDRALARDLTLGFSLFQLVNSQEVALESTRLKNNGITILKRGQTQVVITYDRADLEKLFANVSEGDEYILRLTSASLAEPGDMNRAILPIDAGGQVKITVGEVTSQLQVAGLMRDTEVFRTRNQDLVRNGDVEFVACPQGANDIQCFRIRRPLGSRMSSILNVPIRPGAFNGNSLTASFSTNSTAVAGSDYNLQTPSLTWTAAEAETYQNIHVEILPSKPSDEEVEYFRILTDIQIDGEDVEFPGCTARDGRQTDACIRVELTRPPTLTLATDPVAVTAGGDISLVVTSDSAVPGSLTLPLTISGQVVAGDISGGLTQNVQASFNGGRTATVTIGTIRDNDAAETYTITLGSGNNYMVGNDSTAMGTINRAMPILTLADDPSAVVAGNGISLVVTSDISVPGTLTLSLTINDRGSSGIGASDFTNGLTQTVSANFGGSTTAMVTIATARDGDTAAETYTITLGSGTGYTIGSDNTAAGAINATPPTLTLADDPADAVAGNRISLTVTSDIAVAGSLTLPLTFSGQVVASDISGGLTQSVSANFNGSTSATVMIGTARDGDSAETYTITLGTGSDYTLGTDSMANGTITAATPMLTLPTNPATVAAGESISLTVTSDITVTGNLMLPLTFNGQVVAADITGGLTQTVSANFADSTTATVMIATVKDGDSAAETYTITLGSSTGYTVGSDNTATGVINTVPPTLTLVTNPATVTAGESISLMVTSDIRVLGTLTLSLSFSGQVVANDFTGNTITPSVSANFNGSSTATVMIATARDGDPDETYTITLGTGTGYTVGSNPGDNTATGTISAATPNLRLATDPAAVSAGEEISLTVTSDITVAGTLMLPLTLSGQVVAADITGGLTQTVSANFGGTTTATVTIGTAKDGDPDETYTITLGTGTGYTVGSNAGDTTAAGMITAAMPELTLVDDPADAVAGTDISLTITSDIDVASTLTVPLTFMGQVSAADLNGDTLTQSVSADFGGGKTATVTIGTTKDGDLAETYTITLGSGAGYIVGSDNTADGEITAATPTLMLATDPADVAAGENISLVVTSDISITRALTLSLSFSGDVEAADITGGLTQNISTNFSGTMATVTIGTRKDNDAEEDYTITLATGTGYTVGSSDAVNGTITAVTPELTLATDPADVTAGEDISLVITSDTIITGMLMLPLTFSGDVAAADIDGGSPQTVSANFNDTTSATVTIGTVKDGDPDETYTITLGNGTGYTVGSDNTAMGKITAIMPTLMLATNPAAVNAGEDISLTVTSDIAVASTLMLSLTLGGDVAAVDITGGLSQMVSANFSGTTSATVTIGTRKDNDAEEDYTITLATGTGYTVGSPNAVSGTITAVTPELTLATNPANVAAGEDISLEVTSDTLITSTLTVALTLGGDVVAADITGGLSQTISANFNGSTTATVMIGTRKDNDAEEDYTITLATGMGYTVGSSNAVSGTITAVTPELTLVTSPADVVAGEDISLVITSDTVIASTLTVALTLGGDVVAADITGGLSQMISANFNGTTSATVTIGTVKDGDSDETYTITLANGAGYTAGSSNAVSGTITAATPTLTLADDPGTVTAGSDISLVITSDITVTGTLTLPLTISDLGSSGITADDFTGELTQDVTADFGDTTSATVSIGTAVDLDSSAENYRITLGNSAGYTPGSDNTADGTIDPFNVILELNSQAFGLNGVEGASAGMNQLGVTLLSNYPDDLQLETLEFTITRKNNNLKVGDFTGGSRNNRFIYTVPNKSGIATSVTVPDIPTNFSGNTLSITHPAGTGVLLSKGTNNSSAPMTFPTDADGVNENENNEMITVTLTTVTTTSGIPIQIDATKNALTLTICDTLSQCP